MENNNLKWKELYFQVFSLDYDEVMPHDIKY